jgi:ECF sigma factor
MRFFAGLCKEDIADVLGVSLITVKRDWRVEGAMLLNELRGGEKGLHVSNSGDIVANVRMIPEQWTRSVKTRAIKSQGRFVEEGCSSRVQRSAAVVRAFNREIRA